jgi:hypothetical protein
MEELKKESRKEILTAPTPQLDLIIKFFKLPSLCRIDTVNICI